MKEQLSATLDNSKQYTMEVAAAMPEKDYYFKPVNDVWDFGELLHHIAYGIQWWEANYVKGTKTEWAPPPVKNDKKTVTAFLENTYASLHDTVQKQKLNDDAVRGFYATLDHISHHRGQAITYLRCKGIVAPEYRY